MVRKWFLILLVAVLFVLLKTNAMAQCAMCRASMENSLSDNSENFSAGLNTGIMYLFVMPYLLFAVIAYLWFRASKKNATKIKIRIDS